MKADESRSPAPARAKHKLEHTVPTVIHDPEEGMPLLRRWVYRAMKNPTRFWGLVAGVAVVTLALSLLANGLTLGRATVNEAWAKLETAKTPGDRVEVANEFPNTPAERWAKLQAATEYFNQGFNDLPSNKDAALPALKKALDLFQQVADTAPADAPQQARIAALGVARTLEARNELDKAVAQYEKVAKNPAWAGTEEAREAERLARALKSSDAVAFYKELYDYKAPQMTVPPGGIGEIPLTLPPDHPPLNGPTTPTTTSPFLSPTTTPAPPASGPANEPNPLTVPPPPPTPATKPEAKGTTGAEPGKSQGSDSGSKPLELLNPSAPGAEPKKGGASQPAAPGLPADPFAPK